MNTQTTLETKQLKNLISFGTNELHRGNKTQAVNYFKAALKLDGNNEEALLWCAKLTNNPFDAKVYLRRLLQCNPEHELAKAYYSLAEECCTEIRETSGSGSSFARYRKQAFKLRLGEFLMQNGILNELQIKAALQYQDYLKQEGRHQRLGSILVSFGYLTESQLRTALAY
jgi:tetratricopeptide (TPR) repeat protein